MTGYEIPSHGVDLEGRYGLVEMYRVKCLKSLGKVKSIVGPTYWLLFSRNDFKLKPVPP